MVEGRAAKHYKYFVDTFILWQKLFENTGNPSDILTLPFPLYHDIIVKQVKEKQAEKKRMDEEVRKRQQKTRK